MNNRQTVSATAYFSRIVLPPRLIKDRHGAHRLFWRAFPGHPEDSPQPFLFREEPFAPVASGEAAYVVQSEKHPAWDEVLGLRVVACECVQTEFKENDRFYFRLLASPVRRLMPPEQIRSRGHENIRRLPPREWTRQWFERRAGESGFEVCALVFDLAGTRARTNGKTFKLASVQFDGLLRVNDPERFAAAWLAGVGTKKAFGFGLLSLKRSR